MPSLTIATQPNANSLLTAYNPIPFVIYANQPTSGDPCNVVYADVYFANQIGGTYVYYGTISSTIYYAIIGPYAEYHFDVQDKVQEYLTSLLDVFDPSTGNIGELTGYFTACKVVFRNTDTDANGFTTSVYTEPVQATYFTTAVDGGGRQSSEFIVINAHLRHADNIDAYKHFQKYSPQFLYGYDFGRNLSHRPNKLNSFAFKIGGGNYYVCSNDHDILSFYSKENVTGTALHRITAVVIYKDGTTATQFVDFTTLTPTFNANTYTCHFINAGIPYLSTILTSITWANVKEYTVYIGGAFKDYCIQRYVVQAPGYNSQRIRILFASAITGVFDGINMTLVEEVNKTESSLYQKSKPYISPNKKDRGNARYQPKQWDVVECYTEDYQEEDLPWIKELLGSAQAFIQVNKDTAQEETSEFHPITIVDSDIVTKKKDDNYVYTVSVKYRMSNEVTNIRS